ncbi:sigma-70 family RNA polymerase sigma factor [Streptomyces kanamyceticus]|uniref:Sigma-70 family RNA polymerase sigma factor n=1 Tax=Streptomyces kanamyceticus TaxID=1967 RepID=A0A5J6GFD3_STRKN|nr:sigma-70 family RNA polymerase sigma factor [Streptomyces kanamyceticus]QEU91886.1 sigma-70 family RNA polymerase sigma factor [Streptomyces kanamyceticus]
MDQNEAAAAAALAARFEEHRPRLNAVAYRMLGSLSESEDAVQETWLRLSRSDSGAVENLGGWLTTVVGRMCLDMLRSRQSRREDSLDVSLGASLDTHVPDPVVGRMDAVADPEQEVLLADSVGLALLVVLETLAPAERLAFVLHDMFAVPFDEIAPVVERSAAATRQLASRARRRVQGSAPAPDTDLAKQREVVEAWMAATKAGDFEALLELLDPDVVLRADTGELSSGLSKLVRGAATVAGQAAMFARFAPVSRLVLVNGVPGLVAVPDGEPFSLASFTVVGGRIVEINIIADRERLAGLGIPSFDD